MSKRVTYQNGSVYREARKKSGDVWVLRWREDAPHGRTVQRKVILGSVKDLPTQATARKKAASLLLDVNQQSPRQSSSGMTVGDLANHYIAKELPTDLESVQSPKAHSTAEAYRRYIANWICPKWGSVGIRNVVPIRVEDWLCSLQLAKGTKAKIRNIMSVLFNHAIRYEFLPRSENPIRFVRQGAQSCVVHQILTPAQVWALINELEEPVRTMALLAAFTGLRISEFLALRWSDLDVERGYLNVNRAIVYGKVGGCKTAASRSPVALDSYLEDALRKHRKRTPYNQPSDWMFASAAQKGEKPYTTGSLNRWHLRPAARRAGLSGAIGWHTFRRTFASLLIANGEDVKVVQESMRHANSKMTLDVYAQSTTDAKRTAQSKVITQVVSSSAVTAPAHVSFQ